MTQLLFDFSFKFVADLTLLELVFLCRDGDVDGDGAVETASMTKECKEILLDIDPSSLLVVERTLQKIINILLKKLFFLLDNAKYFFVIFIFFCTKKNFLLISFPLANLYWRKKVFNLPEKQRFFFRLSIPDGSGGVGPKPSLTTIFKVYLFSNLLLCRPCAPRPDFPEASSSVGLGVVFDPSLVKTESWFYNFSSLKILWKNFFCVLKKRPAGLWHFQNRRRFLPSCFHNNLLHSFNHLKITCNQKCYFTNTIYKIFKSQKESLQAKKLCPD